MGEQLPMSFSDTSVDALASIDVTKLERIVLTAIQSFGKKGCISDEVLLGLPGYRYSSITPRYRALIDNGLVEIIGTRKGVSGRQQRVYRALKVQDVAHA